MHGRRDCSRTRGSTEEACEGRGSGIPTTKSILLLLIISAGPACVGPDSPRESASSVVERSMGGGGTHAGRLQQPDPASAAQVAASQAEAEERRRVHEEYMARRREEIWKLATLKLVTRKFADVRELWASSNAAATRGEFETSDEADQRRKAFYSKLFFLDLEDVPKGSGQTVTTARLKRASEARTSRLRYDLDRRALLVRVANGFTGNSIRRLVLFEETTSTKYEGHNAFGATATVDRMVGDSYVVDLRNLDAFVARGDRIPTDEIREEWFAEAPMEPTLVRDRIDKVKVLAVVTVDQETGSWVETLSGEPTFRTPLDTSIQVHITSCWLEALVVYDGEDGTVLHVVVDPTLRKSGG
jgi:hypothetical protein